MKSFALCTATLCCAGLFAQPPSAKLEFEVASIKPSAPMPMGQIRIGMSADAGMVRYSNVSLKDIIRTAYRVKDFQVQGPDWLASTRFDIVAKLPDGATREQVPEMLQTLLAERFKLTLHRETKEHNMYALVVGKGGPKLKPAEIKPIETRNTDGPPPPPPPGGPGAGPPRGAMMIRMDSGGAHLQTPSATLAALADLISRFTERPVVDMTGIEGQYEFDLAFAPETIQGMPGGRMPGPPPGGGEHSSSEAAEPAPTIYDSVQRYGLKLEPRKAPMEILTVDHIERTPTEN